MYSLTLLIVSSTNEESKEISKMRNISVWNLILTVLENNL